MIREFRLYPREEHFCSFADYGAILDTVRRLDAKRVLEFGPGHSTLALVEGGAHWIDCAEDDQAWATVWENRIVRRFPNIVRIRQYTWREPLRILGVDTEQYDLGLIDGPHQTPRRPVAIRYAMARCRRVLVPLEETDGVGILRQYVETFAAQAGRPLHITETGPLAGSFALIGSP